MEVDRSASPPVSGEASGAEIDGDVALPPSLSMSAAVAASHASSSAALGLSALLKQRKVEREREKEEIEKSADRTAAVANEVQGNIRAAVGIHVQAVNQNSKVLVSSAAALAEEVKGIGKDATKYREQYRDLVTSLSEIGSFNEWLRDSQSFLQGTTTNIAAVEALLTKEES